MKKEHCDLCGKDTVRVHKVEREDYYVCASCLKDLRAERPSRPCLKSIRRAFDQYVLSAGAKVWIDAGPFAIQLADQPTLENIRITIYTKGHEGETEHRIADFRVCLDGAVL